MTDHSWTGGIKTNLGTQYSLTVAKRNKIKLILKICYNMSMHIFSESGPLCPPLNTCPRGNFKIANFALFKSWTVPNHQNYLFVIVRRFSTCAVYKTSHNHFFRGEFEFLQSNKKVVWLFIIIKKQNIFILISKNFSSFKIMQKTRLVINRFQDCGRELSSIKKVF